jgi:hypothetical protein
MKRKTYKEVREEFEKHNCQLISEKYTNNCTKLLFQCSCGNLAEITFNQFKKNSMCRICGLNLMKKNKDKGQQPCRQCGTKKELMDRKKHGNICRICYNGKHAEFQKLHGKKYYLNNIEKIKKYSKNRRKNNSELCNSISNTSYHKNRIKVLSHYSPNLCCMRCGFNEHLSALSIDHIDGNGNEMRKNIKGHHRIYYWLKNNGFPKGFQVLCMNCQFIKRYENKECYKKQF